MLNKMTLDSRIMLEQVECLERRGALNKQQQHLFDMIDKNARQIVDCCLHGSGNTDEYLNHELRNLLTPIFCGTQYLLKQSLGPLDTVQCDAIHHIRRAAMRMRDTLDAQSLARKNAPARSA